MQLIDECLLVLTVFRPNILLLSGILLGLHELHDDLVDLLLHAVESYDWLDQAIFEHLLWVDDGENLLEVIQLHEIFLQAALL